MRLEVGLLLKKIGPLLPNLRPSSNDLWELERKSEGIFIYASTLVKFVDDKRKNPKKQLQTAMEAHTGLDSLYKQVLASAREYDYFELAFGAVFLLRDDPSIRLLPRLPLLARPY